MGPSPGRPRRGDEKASPATAASSPSWSAGAAGLAPVREPAAAFAAQLIAGPERRGLRGGAQTIGQAQSTYLGAEWSGPADRRTHRGAIAKKDV